MLSEDKLIDWVESQRGLLITRRTLNIKTFDFNNCAENTLVCVTGYSKIISDFFTSIINNFSVSVILIIIESDVVDLKEDWLYNIKLKHCFTWNKPFHHIKLSGIPIGLNYNRQYNVLSDWLRENNVNNVIPENKKMLCMNYSPHTNPERVILLDKANEQWKKICDILPFMRPLSSDFIPSHIEGKICVSVTNPECYNQWKKYKFVLSPQGAGADCHRTWEAIHVGCIPIVLSSNLNELYEDLPILVLNSWDEINTEFLEKQYILITQNIRENKYNYKKMTLDYWTNKIADIKNYAPKIHFITYGNERFKKSKQRLVSEAIRFGEFASIKAYGPEDLPFDFSQRYKQILEQPRGGGYWIWRPVILNDTIKYINQNDYIVYLDAGCKLNKHGKPRFNEYISMLKNSEYGVLSFQMSGNNGPGSLAMEKAWTIKEIFDYFKVDINSDIANTGQYLGGVLVLKKNEHLKKYMALYTDAILQNPLLCTDMYNKNGNQINEFSDNRHEQSVTSVLRKIMGSVVIDGDESWVVPFGVGESVKYPFWATRLRE